jgi:hypothetical protein
MVIGSPFSAAFGHSNGSQSPLVLHTWLGIRKIESFNKTSRIAFSAPGLPMFFWTCTSQKLFTRNSFPTLRTGNPVDTFEHLTTFDGRHNTAVLQMKMPDLSWVLLDRKPHGEALDGGMMEVERQVDGRWKG